MSKVGVVAVGALAVVGMVVVGSAPSYLPPLLSPAGTEHVVSIEHTPAGIPVAAQHNPAVPPASAVTAPDDWTPDAPSSAVQHVVAEEQDASTAGNVVLDPSLLPPVTAGVRVLQSLPTQQPVVSLTFDVEQGPAPAIAILEVLKAAGVKASFGLTGTFIHANPDVVRRMAREGHDIFNHTYNHPSMPAVSSAGRRIQVQKMEEVLMGVLDRRPLPVFRPPYGNYTPAVLRDLAALGYPWLLLWDVDPQGFRGHAPRHIAQTALRQAKAGSIILMHGIMQDAAALPMLIDGLKQRGLGFVTVSEALGLR